MKLFQYLEDAIETVLDLFTAEQLPSSGPELLHYHDLNLCDKDLWAKDFSTEVDELLKVIKKISVTDLKERLSEFEERIDRNSLSPFYFTLRMKQLAQAFLRRKIFIENFDAKYQVFKNANVRFNKLTKDSLFMERCLEGEVLFLEKVFKRKAGSYLGTDLLRPLFYLKEYVSPFLYERALQKVQEMLLQDDAKLIFNEDDYETLKRDLTNSLDDVTYELPRVPRKIPLSVLDDLDPQAKTKEKHAVDVPLPKTIIFNFLSKLITSPIEPLSQIAVWYFLFASNLFPTITVAYAKQVRSRDRITYDSIEEQVNRRKRTNNPDPLQVSMTSGSFPAVVASNQSNFLDFWIDQASGAGIGMEVSNSSSLLGGIPMFGQMVASTAATSINPLNPQNNPIVNAWCQQVGPGNYTLFAVTIDGEIISSPVALLVNLTSPNFSLSTLSSLGSFLAAVEVRDGSGSGIQVASFNKTLGLNWKGLVNTKTSGNQKFPSIDIYDRGIGDRSVTAYVVWVDETLSGTGYGDLKGTSLSNVFSGSSLPPPTNEIDLYTHPSEYSTLPTLRTMLNDIYIAWYWKSTVTNFNFAYAAKLTGFGSINEINVNTLGRTSTINGGPPVILFTNNIRSGYWFVAWQVCGASSTTINANLFGTSSFSGLGIAVATSSYCGTIAGATSADYSNVMLSWSDQISGSPYIFAVVLPISIRLSNLNTVNTFIQNNQLVMNHPLNLILPPYIDGANIIYNFPTGNVGNFSLIDPSGVLVSSGSVAGALQQHFQGNSSALNSAYNAGIAYNPPQGFCNAFSVGTQVGDTDNVLPFQQGIWTMNCDATASLTTALLTTTQAAVTATTASSVTSTLAIATTTAADAASANAVTAGTFTTSIAAATATTSEAATANGLTTASFTTSIAAATASTATAASVTTAQAAVVGTSAAAVTTSLAAVAQTTTQVAATVQATAGGFTTSVVEALASTTSAASATTQAATSNLASATSVATTIAAATVSATSAAVSTTRGATTSRAATTALSTTLAATTGNGTNSGPALSAGKIAGITIGTVVAVGTLATIVGFWVVGRCKSYEQIKDWEVNRRTTKKRKLADDIFTALNLIELADFNDGGVGSNFAQLIGCIAEALERPRNGESVDIEQKTDEEVQILANQIVESMRGKVTITPINGNNHNSLDLETLRQHIQTIADEVFEIQSKQGEALSK